MAPKRQTIEHAVARGLILGDPAATEHADGSVSIQWGSDRENAAIVTREVLQAIVDDHNALITERNRTRAIAIALDPIPPYVREVPCWTVICDECHRDASEATGYSGFGDRWQDATDFLLADAGGAEACGVAICEACASQKVHCQSCGREHWGFWGNCIDCWNQATQTPQLARVPMDSDRTPEVER